MHFRALQRFEQGIKYWWRSRSFDLARHSHRQPSTIRQFSFGGHPVHYRTGTNDIGILNEVLFRTGSKSEYYFPLESEPRVILDIGGHIGCASIYFARKYPAAKIFTVEAMRDNFELLQKNTAPYPQVRVFHHALGAASGEAIIRGADDSLDTGGRSLTKGSGLGGPKEYRIQVKGVADFLRENGLNDVDFIKIDTEGAEHEILTAFPTEVLSRVKWIIGELHDVQDFELLAYLNRWFHVGLEKPKVRFRYSCFRAANRAMVKELNSYD